MCAVDLSPPKSARDDYGVALSADGRTVDEAATSKLRQQRFDTKLFHRKTYHDSLT